MPNSRQIASLKKDLEAAQAGGLHETRDWEMFTSIGGKLPNLDAVLVLENTITQPWLRSWSEIVQSVIAFAQGIEAVPLGDEVEGVSESDMLLVYDFELTSALRS